MFHNRKSQTGAAGLLASALIHAIKPLCEPRYMLGCDTQPLILYRQYRTDCGICPPDLDGPLIAVF